MRLLVLVLGLAACELDFHAPKGTSPRLLDRACNSAQCTMSGDVTEAEGITPDSTGFRLGPGAAKLTIPLESSTATSAVSSCKGVELLVAGQGVLHAGSQSIVLQDTYAWSCVPSIDNNALVLAVDAGSTVRLVDIRSSTLDYVGSSACSVAAVGAR